MPKLKTHKGAQRRFHVTSRGKIMRVKGGKSHLRRKKSTRIKRQFDKMMPMHPSDATRIKKLLPH
jgi:large subunit ribosomal protein L35